tara:strand:- start:319 stop:1164 length:846 start_codon:yes stop_codon:yes gene_type:complete
MNILWLGEKQSNSSNLVGSKAATLSSLLNNYNVPMGFIIPKNYFLESTSYDRNITEDKQISEAYKKLSSLVDTRTLGVAVRSSSLDEDGTSNSFAGQHDTFLNVKGESDVFKAIIECSFSSSTLRASKYREMLDLENNNAQIPVIVQQMIPSEISGVAFSSNPITKNNNEIFISTSWGLGESIVDGIVTPDNHIVDKGDGSIKLSEINHKDIMIIPSENGTVESQVNPNMQGAPSVSGAQITEISNLLISLESQMGKPVDVEFCYYEGLLYLLQCRPITTL